MSAERVCHYCGLSIPDEDSAIEAKTKNGWAHFTCWYDQSPFERDSPLSEHNRREQR